MRLAHLAAAALTALLAAACSGSNLAGGLGQQAEDPLYDAVRGVTVTLSRSGGLCADGPCGHDVTVSGDPDSGDTSWADSDGNTGATPQQATVELFAHIRNGFDELQTEPFDGTCPTAYDGQELTLSYGQTPTGPDAHLADAVHLHTSTCQYVWPDEFLEQTRRIWDATGAPWPLA